MRGWRLVGLELWMFALALIATASAQGQEEAWIGKIVSVQGQVLAKRQGETQWQPVHLNDTYGVEESLHVGSDSRAAVVLKNGTLLRLDQNTTILFKGMEEEKTFLLEMLKGAGHFFSRQPRSLKIITPFVNGVVKGTEFFVRVDPDQTFISLFDGRVLADNSRGSVLVAKGQSAVARADQPPRLEVVVRPRDAVQWSLYYPPILAFNADDFAGTSADDWQAKVRRSILAVGQGDLEKAFTVIASLGPGIDDPDFFTYRAGLNLVVGRTSDAQADIAQALVLEPDNSRALALRAIMAVVQNRKEDALADANRAVTADPDSAAARIALSYTQQARFDLNAARGQALAATQKSPQNAVAWARLAELQLCTGELDEALSAAQKATRLNPHLAHAQTVLGYAHLIQIKIDNAKEAFDQAIELDQAAPLPRLGLGLAKIRQGDLKDGRAEIEIAAGLDPDNSLIRSYLAKAYLEERRDPPAAVQLAQAKALDPNDPTPWLYDALRKQGLNRPVEALADLQTSVALYVNRAVYRSRLLLDDDQATRSAGLARIYSDLGFDQLALAEGQRAVSSDPVNYSAHRFLSDAHAGQPRHQITRTSELLIAQLLQPININPVQPQLAESNLFIVPGTTPAGGGLNAYDSLFLRNRLALSGGVAAGEQNTLASEVVQSGVWEGFSYSMGHFHHQSDGVRTNNDQEQDLYNLLGQVQVDNKTSLQAEFRARDFVSGDLGQYFDEARQSNTLRHSLLSETYRLGPGSDVIVSFIHQKNEEDESESEELSDIDVDSQFDTTGFEAQHLLSARNFSLVSGAGVSNVGGESTFTITQTVPLEFSFSIPEDSAANQADFYTYATLRPVKAVTLTVGVSYNALTSDSVDRERFNPKFGVAYRYRPGSDLRLAAFKTLGRTIVADQTIEPTQVAGFDQFFREARGTETWNWAGALDHAFGRRIFGGVAYVHRNQQVPYTAVDPVNVIEEDKDSHWRENIGRAYLAWAPLNWFSATLGYAYENFHRDDEFVGPEAFTQLTTQSGRIGAHCFFPSGFLTRLGVSYVDQQGDFGDPLVEQTERDGDRFWVVDAAMGLRLPQRRGLLVLETRNLFNEGFHYQEVDTVETTQGTAANPRIAVDRLILLKFLLSF